MSAVKSTPRKPNGPLAESVEEHRETLEAWAESDLPLSDDIADLLDTVDTGD